MRRTSIALAICLTGCSAVASAGYRAKLKSCVDLADSRETADACIRKVQADYDEAGARPAAKLEGGAE